MTALPNLARDVHKVKFHQVHCISIATNGFFVRDALSSSCSVWPDLVKIRHFCKTLTVWSFVEGLFCIWQTIEPTLAIICYWANFHRCNSPNIEQRIYPSDHTCQVIFLEIKVILWSFEKMSYVLAYSGMTWLGIWSRPWQLLTPLK